MYYIYEIKGVKVGCTCNFERRQKEQLSKGEMVLLEQYTTIEEASKRERELQLEKGYGIDGNSYFKQLKLVELARDPKVVKKRTLNHDYKAIHEKGAPKRKKYYDHFRRYNESNKKPVVQYNLQGTFIKCFDSIANASKQTNVRKTYISDCVRGRQHTAGGYIWKYKQNNIGG